MHICNHWWIPSRPATLVEVAEGEIKHFQVGRFGRELTRVGGQLYPAGHFIDSISFVV